MLVSFVGYQTYKQVINEWGNYHIYIRSSVELDEVKVKGKVNTTKISAINTLNIQTLSAGELEKAACCNLSESFGTNATVDVNFTDAVSGAKQIQMLGLDGVYAQITQENMPLIRGMSSAYGLNYVPGTWIDLFKSLKELVQLSMVLSLWLDRLIWNILSQNLLQNFFGICILIQKENWRTIYNLLKKRVIGSLTCSHMFLILIKK